MLIWCLLDAKEHIDMAIKVTNVLFSDLKNAQGQVRFYHFIKFEILGEDVIYVSIHRTG